ncbi:hypothetical protein [Pseudalkalibacillus decolorationis]|uniref:hypothetical protein n=1 Tax=Pseudalkalibacillus decolorationis TaxID=163879 RepID=UPI0021491795|nr:hypothetical protein [Pseudalkalibacillus decolorationis]
MERKSYYVTIQGGTSNGEVRGVKGNSSYDFEIMATEDEASALKELFNEADHSDKLGYMHAHFFSNVRDTADKDHQQYDRLLCTVYETIYELGTAQTRSDIDEMEIIPRLKEERPDSEYSTGPTMLQGKTGGQLNNDNR